MSDAPQGGWWKAKDGKWYPPETHPDHNASPGAAGRSRCRGLVAGERRELVPARESSRPQEPALQEVVYDLTATENPIEASVAVEPTVLVEPEQSRSGTAGLFTLGAEDSRGVSRPRGGDPRGP